MAKRRGRYEETPPALRLAVLERDGWQCRKCGLSVGQVALEVHHEKALSDGGENTLDNLICVCRNCHFDVHAEARAAINPVYRKRREWQRHVMGVMSNG